MKVSKKLEVDFNICIKKIYFIIFDIINEYEPEYANIFVNMLLSHITEPFVFANDMKLIRPENKEKAISKIKEYTHSLECNLIQQLEEKYLNVEFQNRIGIKS